jgi:putative peptidoglycan lipid II flippase
MIHRFGLGQAGLALATSGVSLFGSVLLFWLIRNRIGGIYGRQLLESTLKIVLASAVMGAAVALSSRLMEGWLGASRLARVADLAISIPLGAAVFWSVCRMTKVAELDSAVRAVFAPLARLIGGGMLKSESNGA